MKVISGECCDESETNRVRVAEVGVSFDWVLGPLSGEVMFAWRLNEDSRDAYVALWEGHFQQRTEKGAGCV